MDAARGTVLLLDEDRDSKRAVKQALEAAGYTVWEAVNGLRLISSLHVDRPDVIVMDTAQAWTDCFDLCHSLKTSDRFKNIRVVLLADEADRGERARLSCCDRLILRSQDTKALLTAISEVLQPCPCGTA